MGRHFLRFLAAYVKVCDDIPVQQATLTPVILSAGDDGVMAPIALVPSHDPFEQLFTEKLRNFLSS